MLCTCDGGERFNPRSIEDLCCDAYKKDYEESIINPLNKYDMETISYTRDGIIKSSKEEYDRDLNEVLHLNGVLDVNGKLIKDTATQLVGGRKAAYDACLKYMQREGGKCKDSKAFVTKLNKRMQMLINQAEYEEYIGVILYLLKKRVDRG